MTKNRRRAADDDSPAWILDVREALARGDREAAAEALRRQAPFSELDGSRARAAALLCEEAGLSTLALSAYRRVLADDRADAEAAVAGAEILREQGRAEEAAPLLEGLPGLGPQEEGFRTQPSTRPASLLHGLYTDLGLLANAERLLARLRRFQEPELDALADDLEAGSRAREDEDIPWAAAQAEDEDRAARTPASAAGSKEVPAERLPGSARPAGGSEKAGPAAVPSRPGPLEPRDSDLVRMLHLFSGREGIYARQWWNEAGQCGYSPVREPLTPRVLENHILGNITVGVYPVRQDGTALFFALDLDITKRAMERVRAHPHEARDLKLALHEHSLRMIAFFRESGIEPVLEDSGYKGRHLWVFLRQPETCEVLYRLGVRLQAVLRPPEPELHIEFFPKQPKVAPTGVGNLIKLPLGIHRRTGRRGPLLDEEGVPIADPFALLRRVQPVAREQLYDLIEHARRAPDASGSAIGEPGGGDDGDSGGVPTTRRERPGPPPPEPAPPWTEADFDRDPEVSHLLSSCPVLAGLRDQVTRTRRLAHDERVVLAHVLGHRATGVLAVNYLFERCVNVPETERLQTPFSGNPISCPKIRKRIPRVTAMVDCHCDFGFAPDHYPTPLLHLLRMPPPRPAPPAAPSGEPEVDPGELGSRLGILQERAERLAREADDLRRLLAGEMERRGLERLEYGTGAMVLRHDPGAPPVLEWVPAGAGQGPDAAAMPGCAAEKEEGKPAGDHTPSAVDRPPQAPPEPPSPNDS